MILRCILSICLYACVIGCNHSISPEDDSTVNFQSPTPQIIILGTIQDAGSPHIACNRECCERLITTPDPKRKVVSLGLFDPDSRKTYLFEATPDMPAQLKALKTFSGSDQEVPDGVFLTHAHIGHYTGLMYFGKEAMNADHIPIYVMPSMKNFLSNNGPWSQLTGLGNIELHELNDAVPLVLSPSLSVTPFLVPHRDEFSETAGYLISGPNKSLLFIPDIDKWHRWEKDIIVEIEKVDYALIDGSFFNATELDYRNMDEIPHPSIEKSMEIFKNLPSTEKDKIYFIHFNHTNPILNIDSQVRKSIEKAGFHISAFHQKISL
jgi:pyrroloquinoline quinone biosynthesis protein B